MSGYVVVEGQSDEDALRRAWATNASDPLADVRVLVAGDRTRLDTVARSLLVDGKSPVIVLGDADTTDEDVAKERQSFIESRLREVAPGGWLVRLLLPALDAWIVDPNAALRLARDVQYFIRTQGGLVEQTVIQYLERRGWRIVERQPRLADGRTPDFLVAKDGIEAVVELKESDPGRVMIDELIGFAVVARLSTNVVIGIRDTPMSRAALGPVLPSLQTFGGISVLLVSDTGDVDEFIPLPDPHR